jgi:hypothetical protein
MEKMIFNTDDIHKLRIELADRREHMPPEEARRDFDARVASGKRRIKEIREAKANAPMQNAQ